MSYLDHYIYLWTNTTSGKKYVGRGRRRRAYTHLQDSCGSPLAKAIRKHGRDVFSLVFLETGLSHAQASVREQFHIAALQTIAPMGYNLTRGGEGVEGYRHTETSLLLIRERASNRSPEHQEKINAARRTPEARAASAALGARTKGSKRTPEQRARQSEAHLGVKSTPEAVAKTRAALLGRPKTPEHRRKLAEANLGKKQAEATIALRIAAQQATNTAKRISQLAYIESLPEGSERTKLEARFTRAAYMRKWLQEKAQKNDHD